MSKGAEGSTIDYGFGANSDCSQVRWLTTYNGGNTIFDLGNANAPLAIGVWKYFVGTYNQANARMYMNGSQIDTTASTTAISNTGSALDIGKLTAADLNWNGQIDEVRISNSVRSADWITTEYNNQNSPSTFYTVGSPIPSSAVSYVKFR